jgi:hypothetical protein
MRSLFDELAAVIEVHMRQEDEGLFPILER